MDKKLKREVGYKREAPRPVNKIKSAPKVEKVDTQEVSPSKELYRWLASHHLINLNGLCREVGYDRGNLIKAGILGKNLKPEIIAKFATALKPYGYPS